MSDHDLESPRRKLFARHAEKDGKGSHPVAQRLMTGNRGFGRYTGERTNRALAFNLAGALWVTFVEPDPSSLGVGQPHQHWSFAVSSSYREAERRVVSQIRDVAASE